jgi:hypothetical protein
VNAEAHVAGVEANSGGGMGSAIVQEMSVAFGSGFSSLCLDACECAKGDEEGGVVGMSVVQKCVDDCR